MNDVAKALEKGEIVIIDTSRLSDRAELLIGDLVISEVLFNYQKYRAESGLSGKSKFEDKPVIGIVIEEAPKGNRHRSNRTPSRYCLQASGTRREKIQDRTYRCYAINKRYSSHHFSKYEYQDHIWERNGL